jgi:hypothetical protein
MLANERLRHAYPGAGMLMVAATAGRVDDLDDQGERADLAGAGPGGRGDQIAFRGGDRRSGRTGRPWPMRPGSSHVPDAEAGGDEGGELVILDVGRA